MDVESNEWTENEARMQTLERKLARTQRCLWACAGGMALFVAAGMARPSGDAPQAKPAAKEISDVLYTRKLVVLDDTDVARITIGQDPVDSNRRSRAAGITICDKHGNERGGMGTFDDDSVTMALDAPKGVGDAMRDRVGMMVGADGSSQILLIDNETRGVAKLVSFGDGRGGLQLFKWEKDKVVTKTLGYDGEKIESFDLGPR
jgi:hypothetical protein